MKLILKNHNGKYAVSKRKAPNSRKWCSTWENSISFAFGHFVKLLYNQSQKMPPNPNCPPIPFSRTGLIYQGMSASPWLSHPGPAKALNCEHLSQKTKYERVFFHLDVGIELNCEPRIKGLALTLLLKILRWLDVWGQPVIVELESWQQAIHKIEV